jgi:hypothetical protein
MFTTKIANQATFIPIFKSTPFVQHEKGKAEKEKTVEIDRF